MFWIIIWSLEKINREDGKSSKLFASRTLENERKKTEKNEKKRKKTEKNEN